MRLEMRVDEAIADVSGHPQQDWFRLLTDPDRAEMERMLGVGQLVTWPKVIGFRPMTNSSFADVYAHPAAAHDRQPPQDRGRPRSNTP